MTRRLQVLSTDVLVIGSGAAGLRAAIGAAQTGAEVIIAAMGSGSSPGITALNVLLSDHSTVDSEERFVADTTAAAGDLGNPLLVQMLVRESARLVQELENIGICFDRGGSGYRLRQVMGSSIPRSLCKGDLLGSHVLQRLSELAASMPEITMQRGLRMISLNSCNGQVVGAFGFHMRTSRPVVVIAQSTVVAAGGLGHLYPFSTNPSDVLGDGCAMALDVGADLVDMEFIQFEPTIAIPPTKSTPRNGFRSRGLVVPTALFADGAVLYDRNGSVIYAGESEGGSRVLSKEALSRRIFECVSSGLGGPLGGVFMDLRNVPTEKLRTYPELLSSAEAIGIKIMSEPFEVRPAYHYTMGGIRINERCETSLPGLFAAGEAAGGIHGAGRIAGNSATDTLVFGAIAGKHAALRARTMSQKGWEEVEDEVVESCLESILSRGTICRERAAELIIKMQQIMDACVGIVRTENGLMDALEGIGELRADYLSGVRLDRSATDDLEALMASIEVSHALTNAESVTRAALERRESRGAHYRKDYPHEDRNQQRSLLVRKVRGEVIVAPVGSTG